MKKVTLLVGLLVLIISSLNAQSYSGGSGTSEDPYQIANKTDLKYLSENSGEWSKHFKQTDNIVFESADFESGGDFYNSGAGFIPIGGGSAGATDFSGSYDGNGYSISNVYINRSSTSRIGFFGRIDNSGIINNVTLTNVSITGGSLSAGLVGQLYGIAQNCSVSGSVSGTYATAGCVGQFEGAPELTDCSNSATIVGTSSVGGIVGYGYDLNISECYNRGTVSGQSFVGGLFGYTDVLGSCIISDSYSTADIIRTSGTDSNIGAFCGLIDFYYEGPITIEYCYSTGSITYDGAADPTDKGFVGSVSEGSINYISNFWDSEASNQSSATGATAKTTDEMKTENFSGWDWTNTWERIGYNYPSLQDNPDPTLPVTLSAFTAQFIENIPTIHWSTQSETDNMGWFIYGNEENDFSSSEVISKMIEGHGTTTQQQFYTYEDDLQDAEVGDSYYYWLESVDYRGIINHYNRVAVLTIPENSDPGNNGVSEPERFGLFQNEPNPVISTTKISFNLHETSKVNLAIYNLKGQLMKKLYSGVTSKHIIMWDGKDDKGKRLENGVYLYELLINGKRTEIKKLILMR